MKEVEVKILEVDREAIEGKLLELGATKEFEGELQTLYFDSPTNALPKHHETLRLRQVGEKAVLTLKKKLPKSDVKQREEFEVEVGGFLTMYAILKELGYEISSKTKKRRVSFHLNNIHFDFDKYLDDLEHIPELLEIEAPDEDMVWDYVAKIGYEKKDCKDWAAGKLFKKYSKAKKTD